MPITTAAGVADSTAAYITNAQTTANTAITNLNNVASGWTSVTWASLSASALNSYADFGDTDATIKTALTAFDTAMAAIVAPTLGAAPVLTGYNAPIWSDTFWTNLKSLLGTFTANITGSDDVSSVVTKLTSETPELQVALYAADRERKQQALRDQFSAAAATTGARGFSHPNCMTNALRLAAQQGYAFDLSQTSRDLIKLIFEWAKSNYQFSVQQQVSAHNADVDFNMRYAATLIQVYDAEVKNVLEKYRATFVNEATKMEMKIKEYALRLDVTKANNANSEAKDRINASNFGSLVQQHATDVAKSVEAAASNAKNRIDAAVAAVNAAANMVSSASQISIGILNG